MRLPIAVAVALLLLGLAQAQPITGIKGRQYIFCPCSPGKRGFRDEVQEKLLDFVHDLNQIITDLRQDRTPKEQKATQLVEESTKRWSDCVASYSMEECVNADAALRLQSCYPECMSFCEYDRGSWRNSANGVFGPVCESDTKWKSSDIISGAPEVKQVPVNPNKAAEKAPLKSNERPTPSRAPIDSTGSPGPDPGLGGDSSIPAGSDAGIFDSPEPPDSKRNFEGCIAVEHLDGLVLQHPRHIRRVVLCGRGFCATPNHALIVRGQWTSMKKLCADEWECVRTVKLVNNLKVAANTRAVVNGDITITPYDLRYPIWAVWLVQMLEDVFNLLLSALLIGGVAVAGLAVSVQVQKSLC